VVEFGPPGPELSQGDLFALVPSVYVRDLSYMVRLDTARFRLESDKPPNFNIDKEHQATATSVRRAAIVLTHDCEIDKEPARASLLMALVRPLSAVNEDDRDGFRTNTRHRAFYLPENDYLDGESYADLRAVTTIRRDTLESLSQLAAMNEDGRRMLREQLFRFFARRYLPDDWTGWPSDE
jgi:hypothetical protein